MLPPQCQVCKHLAKVVPVCDHKSPALVVRVEVSAKHTGLHTHSRGCCLFGNRVYASQKGMVTLEQEYTN